MKARALVIGVSAGGFDALQKLLPSLKVGLGLSIFIVQHMQANSGSFMIEHLNGMCSLPVKYAEDKEPIEEGVVYIAPPNYHLLISDENQIALDVSEPLNYSRPSVDVLFETASDVFTKELMGIVLTGSNQDGSNGLKYIKENGGYTISQDPDDASFSPMPQFAIEIAQPDAVMTLDQIRELLSRIDKFSYER